jgi:chromate transporter
MILLELFLTLAKVGLFTFGGGYAMLPLIESEIIDGKGWLTLAEFTDIVAIAEVTPGPIAVNSATFVGYRLGGIPGGVIATLGVIAPSVVIVLLLAALARKLSSANWLVHVRAGMRPAVVGLIAAAVISVGRVAFADARSVIIGIGAAAMIFWVKLHPILVLALSGLAGAVIFSLT